jgi:hypothetical protein
VAGGTVGLDVVGGAEGLGVEEDAEGLGVEEDAEGLLVLSAVVLELPDWHAARASMMASASAIAGTPFALTDISML